MYFRPPCCPRPTCPSRTGTPFRYRVRGVFQRKCDGRVVPRFECRVCRRGFSRQTFRVDYRLKRPSLLALFFVDRVSKVTHRQSARNHRCSRSTEERHFRRLSDHCAAFHGKRLAEVAARGGLGRVFLLDELETYEHHRTEQPVTVPILIERESGFVLDARVGALPARGKSGARRARERNAAQNSAENPALDAAAARPPKPAQDATPRAAGGSRAELASAREAAPRRRSESRAKVRAAFECLRAFCPKDRPLTVRTDMKSSYATLLVELFGRRCTHERTAGTRRRDLSNPLWPINHTFARARDGLSRLVRETWAAAKLREWLAAHLAIWVCYRNYVRGRINRTPHHTPAMVLGAENAQWTIQGLLEWRVFAGV